MPPDLDEVVRSLEQRRSELRNELATLTAVPRDPMVAVSFGKRIGDGTTEAVERLNTVGAANSIAVTLADVERALDKLADGTYGACDGCGEAIGDERLRCDPLGDALHLMRPCAPFGVVRVQPGVAEIGLGGRPCAFGPDDVHRRVDQRQVRERLREVAEMPARPRIDLLREQSERTRERQQLLEERARLVQLVDLDQRGHQPEGADRERPFLAGESVVGLVHAVAKTNPLTVSSSAIARTVARIRGSSGGRKPSRTPRSTEASSADDP